MWHANKYMFLLWNVICQDYVKGTVLISTKFTGNGSPSLPGRKCFGGAMWPPATPADSAASRVHMAWVRDNEGNSLVVTLKTPLCVLVFPWAQRRPNSMIWCAWWDSNKGFVQIFIKPGGGGTYKYTSIQTLTVLLNIKSLQYKCQRKVLLHLVNPRHRDTDILYSRKSQDLPQRWLQKRPRVFIKKPFSVIWNCHMFQRKEREPKPTGLPPVS